MSLTGIRAVPEHIVDRLLGTQHSLSSHRVKRDTALNPIRRRGK